jgi:hypothetical protein
VRIPAVTTGEIYKGAIAFIVIQLFMIALVIAWPNLVLGGLDKKADINLDEIKLEMPLDPDAEAKEAEEAEGQAEEGEGEEGEEEGEEADDPAKALMEEMKKERRRRRSSRPRSGRPAQKSVAATGAKKPRHAGGVFVGSFRLTSSWPEPPSWRTAAGLHEVVEVGLGEAEPGVLVVAELGVVLVDLLPVRVLRAQLAVEPHRRLVGRLRISRLKGRSWAPPATRRFRAAGFLAS